jgi:hypothetical protein
MRGQLAGIAVAAAVLATPAVAGAAADIEGVWSFSGGQVAVKAQPDGTFQGLVIRETTFDPACTHPIGQLMWEGVTGQQDGSYWGGHRWFNTADCSPIGLGRTAWRVLATPDNRRFLRVCFSKPETPDVQPLIAPDGTSTNVNEGCSDSDLIGQLTTTPPKLKTIAVLPKKPSHGCRRSRVLRVKLRQPPMDALSNVQVTVNGKQRAQRDAQNVQQPMTLTHVPRGRTTVRVRATTVLGRQVTGKRVYRICNPKRR